MECVFWLSLTCARAGMVVVSSFLTLPVSWLIGVPCLVHDICYSFSGQG